MEQTNGYEKKLSSLKLALESFKKALAIDVSKCARHLVAPD